MVNWLYLKKIIESFKDNSDFFSLACACDMTGSKTDLCDKDSGQCSCKEMFSGRRCDNCIFGYVGFPDCHGNALL